MKYEGEFDTTPPEKTTFKKPIFITVNRMGLQFNLLLRACCESFNYKFRLFCLDLNNKKVRILDALMRFIINNWLHNLCLR